MTHLICHNNRNGFESAARVDEKRLAFEGGGLPGGTASPEPPKTEMPPEPNLAEMMPPSPEAGAAKPVDEKSFMEELEKGKQEAQKKVGGQQMKIDALANLKVDEIKIPA